MLWLISQASLLYSPILRGNIVPSEKLWEMFKITLRPLRHCIGRFKQVSKDDDVRDLMGKEEETVAGKRAETVELGSFIKFKGRTTGQTSPQLWREVRKKQRDGYPNFLSS